MIDYFKAASIASIITALVAFSSIAILFSLAKAINSSFFIDAETAKAETKAVKKVSASMKKDELIAFAKENNIAIDEKATKAVIIEAIEAALK